MVSGGGGCIVTLSHSSSKPCGAHVVLPRPIQLRMSTEFSRYKIPPEFLLPYFRKLPSELALNFTELVRILRKKFYGTPRNFAVLHDGF
jgi:hypothetical protein